MINCAKMLLNFKLSKFVWFVYGDEDDDGHYFLEGKLKKILRQNCRKNIFMSKTLKKN